eukprot:scaffold40564_cov19-Tisochrysis_lutea.AAC.1
MGVPRQDKVYKCVGLLQKLKEQADDEGYRYNLASCLGAQSRWVVLQGVALEAGREQGPVLLADPTISIRESQGMMGQGSSALAGSAFIPHVGLTKRCAPEQQPPVMPPKDEAD